MKKLLIGIIALSSTFAFAENLSLYIDRNLDEVCATGESISIHEANSILENLEENTDDGCQLFSTKVYNSLYEAGMSSNDNYDGKMLAVKLINNDKASIDASSITMRDIPLCIKRHDGDELTVGYQVSASQDFGYPAQLFGNKNHTRKSIIQIKNNRINWAGQTITNHTRTNFIQNGIFNYYFRCGTPK